MGTYTAKRFQVGTTLAYAEIIELRDAAWVNDVRYVIRKTCCDKLELKSHKALRTAYQRHWDVLSALTAQRQKPQGESAAHHHSVLCATCANGSSREAAND